MPVLRVAVLRTFLLNVNLLAAMAVLSANGAAAATETFEYPELAVVPSASERINMEAEKESGRRWLSHWPIQASALATTVAGVMQRSNVDVARDATGISSMVGLGIGGGWLAATVALSALYQPYASAKEELAKLPAKDRKEKLTRERVAEEAIEGAARLGTRLRWISAASNLGASAYMLMNVKKSSIGFGADVAALILSFTPIIFPYAWETVACDHEDYKKRIYAPVASATVFQEPVSQKWVPGVAMTYYF